MTARATDRRSTGAVPVAVTLARLSRTAPRLPPRTEWVAVLSALGRVPSRAVRARRVLPPHDQSTMDGYAVRSRRPVLREGRRPPGLRVVGRSTPGDEASRLPHVDGDTAVEILTGAPLPPGADSVLRLEDCRRSGDTIWPRRSPTAGKDVARRGDDFRPGRPIVDAGTPLRPWHLAALLANEVVKVRVVRRLRVGVLSTGNELVATGRPLRSGGVRDTTRPLLLALLAELDVPSLDLGLVPDEVAAIRRAVRRGLATCDVLITTGGSSVGKSDLVPAAIQNLGTTRWMAARVRLRPGATTGVAVVGRRPVFLLSGPPVAAFSGFMGLVEPFLRERESCAGRSPPSVSATLATKIAHARGVRELVRVRLKPRKGRLLALAVERHGASRLSSLTGASGLMTLEERRGDYRAGERVRVVPL